MDSRPESGEPGTVAPILRPGLLETLTLFAVAAAAILDVVLAMAYGRPPAATIDTLLLLSGVLAARLKFSPWWAVVGAVIAPVAAAFLGQNPTDAWPVAAFAVFLATTSGVSAPLAGLVAAAANCVAIFVATGQLNGSMLAAVLAPIALASAGATVREQRRHSAATARYLTEADAARESEIRERIALERIRIARELHDALGQEVALVSMSLGAAQIHLPPGAEEAASDLSVARKGLHAVLRETQRIVAVLRTDPGDDLAQVSSYDQIDSLVESFLTVGLDLKAAVDPCPPDLDLGVGAAVYRIAQEALTNANRHGVGPVSLTVTGSTSQVLVEVSNPIDPHLGPAAAADEARLGFGLVGMRERAASVGGTLAASALNGVFTVRAILPVSSRGAVA